MGLWTFFGIGHLEVQVLGLHHFLTNKVSLEMVRVHAKRGEAGLHIRVIKTHFLTNKVSLEMVRVCLWQDFMNLDQNGKSSHQIKFTKYVEVLSNLRNE